jgi:predicted nucleic acid-binding protein
LRFDLAAALRRIRPQRRSGALIRRDDGALPFVTARVAAGAELLLDTCVYIDVIQGRTPGAVDALLVMRICNHSSICLAELTHLFGRLDPARSETPTILKELSGVIEDDIPPHRLISPSARAQGEAGMLAGLAARLGGYSKEQTLLNDAILYLQAIERGCVVLTRNLREFDLFDQLLPCDRVLFYRQSPAKQTS